MRISPNYARPNRKVLFAFCFAALILALVLAARSGLDRGALNRALAQLGLPSGRAARLQTLQRALVGTWSGMAGTHHPVPLVVEFRADGAYAATQTTEHRGQETVQGTYRLLSDTQLEMVVRPSSEPGAAPKVTELLTFALKDNTLTLRDQQQTDMTLTKAPDMSTR